MNRILWIVLTLVVHTSVAQNVLFVQVTDARTQKPIADADVFLAHFSEGSISNSEGKVTLSYFPNGWQDIKIAKTGYRTEHRKLYFPLKNPNEVLLVSLWPEPTDTEKIPVSVLRTSTNAETSATRVQVVATEELQDRINLMPANVAATLSAKTGIQLQQTSALSGNMQFRLQGLNGNYTQLLRDGFPVFGGMASNLSLLHLNPTSLKQIEVLKGAASALYGGDGLAGAINLVSKQPTRKTEVIAMLNASHKGAKDLNGWYSGYIGNKLGLTTLVAYNAQSPRDVNKDGYTDLVRYQTLTVEPKLFYKPDPYTQLMAGVSITNDKRWGGNLTSIEDNKTIGVETNETNRVYTQLRLDYLDENGGTFVFKNSVNAVHYQLGRTSGKFDGKQAATYTEASYVRNITNHQVVAGIGVITDHFTDQLLEDRSYKYATMGAFAQDDWKILNNLTIQASLRSDYVTRRLPTVVRTQGDFLFTPRVAVRWQPIELATLRLSAGQGYQNPTIFNYQTERDGYQSVQPFTNTLQIEKSSSLNANFVAQKRVLDDWLVMLEGTFFLNKITNPLVVVNNRLTNASAGIVSKGSEWNVKVNYENWQLGMGYTFTNALKEYDTQHQNLEFAPRNRFHAVLQYEHPNQFRAFAELSMVGKQYIGDGVQAPSYGLMNLSGEKYFGKITVFLSLKNIGDTRQTRLENVLLSALPTFRPVYAPWDGFVGNLGLRLKL
ncbi:MAG: TonB-dependent receptor [Spirosomataceae bacterium]